MNKPPLRFKEFTDNWQTKKLGDISYMIDGDRGKNYPKQKDLNVTGYCLFLNTKNILKENYNFRETQFISENKHNQLKSGVIKLNDIVITTRGTIGNLALFDSESFTNYKNIRVNSGMVILRFNINLNFKYVHSYLVYKKRSITNLSSGSTIPQLPINVLKNLQLSIPTIKEQEKIANFLTSIDCKINLLEKKKSALEDHKKTITKKIFTQEIRFPGFTKEWEYKMLGVLGNIFTGNTPPKKDIDNYGHKYCWATAKDFTNKYITNTEIKLSEKGKNYTRWLPVNSVLVTCIASIGLNSIAKVELATNQQINAIIVNENNNYEFVYQIINYNTDKIKLYAGRTAVPIINKSTFSKIKFKIPTIEEQEKIADFLSAIDKHITAISKKIELTREYKKYLLQNMFV